jgi:hypothetical protein
VSCFEQYQQQQPLDTSQSEVMSAAELIRLTLNQI